MTKFAIIRQTMMKAAAHSWIGVIALLVFASWPAGALRAAEPASEPVYRRAAVAADHPLASEAGLEILKRGGNVVDAAVATSFALSVVRPASCGVGGGGFLLYWDAARRKAVAIDFREKAPARATREMFFDPDDPTKVRANASEFGHLAVAVPGQVAGLCRALQLYGTLDLKDVLAPALRLCRDGFVGDAHDAEVQQEVLDDFRKHAGFEERFATLHRMYLNRGQPWGQEQKFHSPLAPLLERIAAHGADGFYRGPVAEAIVAEMRRGGGLITLEDLAAMQPTIREPLTGRLDRWDLYTMPPPSSGGVALLEVLEILSACDRRWPEKGLRKLPFDSPQRWHLLTESFKHAFADRAAYLGDADFADVPFRQLLGREHFDALASRIDLAKTAPSNTYGRFTLGDDSGTSHVSIIDSAGNAVACTETINTAFGSFVVEPQFGIILNNEMDDFTAHPEAVNAFGLRQSQANAIAPGKRPLSSMTPTILVRDGKADIALGGSGGPRIITATTQVLLNLTQFGKTPAEAIRAPRLHHQWLPDRIDLEAGFDRQAAQALESFGHTIRWTDDDAVVQAVARSADGLRAASDLRKLGRAAGD